MPLPLSEHSFHISCGSCLLATSAQSPRPASRLVLRPVGRGGQLRRPCLLASLPLCRRALRLSALLAWRGVGGGVRRMKKAGGGVCFPRPLVRAFIGCYIRLGRSRSDSVAC